jgi:ribose transport system permease protein
VTRRRPDLGIDRFSGLYLWAVFIIVFSVLAPATFPSMSTVHLLASTQAIAGMIALGLLVPMVTGQFDLSIGATANLAGICTTMVQLNDVMGPIPAVLLGVAVGAAVGFVNGFVVVRLKVDSFIATLGMGSILAAFLVIVTGNLEPLPVDSELFSALTQTEVLGFQLVFAYMLVLAVVVWWLVEHTPAGRYMRATGSNREAARLSGVAVDRWAWISLTASGAICGLAGVLFVSLTGPSLGFGNSLLLPAFAAVFLGSTQLTPGRINVWGTVLAIFVLATGVQGLQLVSGVQWVAAMFNGVAVIAAVALAVGREKKLARGQAHEAAPPSGPDAATAAEPAAAAPSTSSTAALAVKESE